MEEKKSRQKKSPEQKKAEFAKKFGETGDKMLALCKSAHKLQLSDSERSGLKSYIETVCQKCMGMDSPKKVDFVQRVFGAQ